MSAVETLERSLASIAGKVELARPRFDVEPVSMVAPASTEQVSELLRLASRDKLRVIPFGLGSKLGWCGIPGHVDFMLSTRNLKRVVSHVPDDGTISVEAGMTMDELKRRCREGGHFLTPDVPRPERCTIGGVVAANESGFDRLRFGPVRHHVLGTKVVLADGTIAKSGGQLVKNVTGFDLHRLYCGSHGTLCVIVEVSLRLFPEPEHELLVTARAAAPGEALEIARRALTLPARIVSLTAARSRATWSVSARLFGKRAAVEDERESLARAWPDAARLAGEEARSASALLPNRVGELPRACFHVTCPPSQLAAAMEECAQHEGDLVAQPGVACIESWPSRASAELARSLRARVGALGGALHYRDAPREELIGLDPFGEAATGLDLMRRLQKQLDPQGVFSTGRFHGAL